MKSKYPFFFFFLFVFFSSCRNDKTTPPIPQFTPQKIVELADELPEISGIIFQDEQSIYAHNDGGHGPYIFEVSIVEKELIKKVKIWNAQNMDWEDITEDEEHIYIGDFGNNNGAKMDLKIYKIAKSDVQNLDSVEAKIIAFQYPDQTNFEESNNHNFDCEAMISVNDSLILFSKNRQNFKTKMYSIPKEEGTFTANKHSEFDVDGLITGASFDKGRNIIALLGYHFSNSKFDPFLWLFYDFPEGKLLEGKNKKLNFSLQSQMESISFGKNYDLFFVPESESGDTQFIYKMNCKSYLN